MGTYKFSIIIPTFNCSANLNACLKSLSIQNYKNFELIIIDNLSKDNIIQVVNDYKSIITHYISESDNGIYSAFNKGLSISTGSWIMFLGSDDIFLSPSTLCEFNTALENLPANISLVYSKLALLKNGKINGYFGETWCDAKIKLSSKMSVPHTGSIHKREFFLTPNPFDEDFKIAGDYDLLLKMKDKISAFYLDKVLVGAGSGGISNSPKFALKATLEIRRAQIKNCSGFSDIKWGGKLIFSYLSFLIYIILGDRVHEKMRYILNKLR